MATEKIPMTPEGFRALEDELRQLRQVERPEIIKAIAAAREHGDLSENAEYHSAREKQGFIEGRILELEDVVSRADLIDPKALTGNTIRFGATVKLTDEDSDEESTFQIVGSYEANVEKGLISITSPLARALIGKKAGDSAEVNAPSGPKSYEIIKVQFK
ncbi:MAG: transcription elongation factor GreA [Rhodospirillales bacterium]|jgi:transcription elongation factor GreA|nr:transcription elongation factor GreA [Rhodospirillales bacterium]